MKQLSRELFQEIKNRVTPFTENDLYFFMQKKHIQNSQVNKAIFELIEKDKIKTVFFSPGEEYEQVHSSQKDNSIKAYIPKKNKVDLDSFLSSYS